MQALLGERERRRDLLIEHLHLLQDHYGCLHARHLAALAEEMRLALVEVYEVASFYAHFDIVMDDEAPPPALTVRVCDSLTCALFGARAAARASCTTRLGDGVRVVRAPCMGGCHNAPVVRDRPCAARARHGRQRRGGGRARATRIPTSRRLSVSTTTAPAAATRCCEACLAGRAQPRGSVIEALEKSELRGLGGAGFPTGRKWRFVLAEPGPRLMAVNGDEGEPGTFKDRYFLETDPHRFLEGMLIAAWVVEAPEIYIYLRDEYPQCREVLRAGDRRRSRRPGSRRTPASICGAAPAPISAARNRRCSKASRASAGCRATSRRFPSQVGLFGRPTLINNIETLLLGARHRREGAGMVHRPGPQRPQGAAHLLGVGPGARTPASSSPRPASPRAS